MKISDKEMKLLLMLDRNPLIMASWQHPVLFGLWKRGLVCKTNMVKPNGRSAISSAWSITSDGRAHVTDFLASRK